MNEMIPVERIESRIYLIRGQKVMLDKGLAELYGVTTGRLNEQVKRNISRFPADFMFQLTHQEYENLKFHFGTSNLKSQSAISSLPAGKAGWGGRRKLPYAFTEQGVAMLSSVLNSDKAIEVNVLIMRAFVKLRQVLATNKDLTYLFKELKHKVDRHDTEIGLIIKAIEKMIAMDSKPKRKIGFITKEEK
ncbi:MAG: ORF6N domain-containing protein [Candidatus Margulisiibacteriota bacterium]